MDDVDPVQRQNTIVGQLISDHPQDFAATLDAVNSGTGAVNSGTLGPEQTVLSSFPVELTADALASVREIPGKAWINVAGWRNGS